MYPILRTLSTALRARGKPLGLTETDSTTLRIWPIDIDVFLELNNGRILTLYDLGRFTLSVRIGLIPLLRKNKWGFAVAGSFIRYRHRVTLFQKVEIRTRVLGPEGRFVLMEQGMWRGETCCSHALMRVVVTGPDGVVPPETVLSALGHDPGFQPELPAWAEGLITAEGDRPWPPDF